MDVRIWCAGQPAVSVNGSSLGGWTFDAMNVLAWTEEAGVSAWLQFMVLPGGPIYMGSLKTTADVDGSAGARLLPIYFPCCTCASSARAGRHDRMQGIALAGAQDA